MLGYHYNYNPGTPFGGQLRDGRAHFQFGVSGTFFTEKVAFLCVGNAVPSRIRFDGKYVRKINFSQSSKNIRRAKY